MDIQLQVIKGTGAMPGMMYKAEGFARQRDNHAGAGQAATMRRLEITNTLQTTLEVRKVIELFAEEIVLDIAFDGMSYHLPEAGICVELGQQALHSCSYRLTLAEQHLGELRLMRRKRFSEEEIALFELLLCALMHPLHNAVLYHRALQAAHTDALTGLNNRTALDAVLRREVEFARRYQTPFSLIVMDVDHFKSINDRYGHAIGDAALKALADCARQTLRSTDMVFRYGGEEFVVLLSSTDESGALLVAERLRCEVEKCRELPITMTISLGTASLRRQESAGDLLDRADQALYEAKRNGRNRACAAA